MPIQLDSRPKSWTKPSLEENDPIINHVPFFVHDKIDDKTLKLFAVIRWFVVKEIAPLEPKYYDPNSTQQQKSNIVYGLREKAQNEYYIGHLINGTQSKYADNYTQSSTSTSVNHSNNVDDNVGDNVDNQNAKPVWNQYPNVFKLSPLEYGVVLQIMGSSLLSFKVISILHYDYDFFSSTERLDSLTSISNMCAVDLIYRHGTKEQIEKFLYSNKMYNFKILISEQDCGSSDHLNAKFSITLNEKKNSMVLNGNKWFVPNAFNRCACKTYENCDRNGNQHDQTHANRKVETCWLLYGVTENAANASIQNKHSIVLIDENTIDENNLQVFEICHDKELDIKYFHLKFKNVVVPYTRDISLLGSRGNGNNLLNEKSNLSKIYNSLLIVGLAQECMNKTVQNSEDSIRITNKNIKLSKSDYFKNKLAEYKIDLENCKNACYNALLKFQSFNRNNNCKNEVYMAKYMTPLKCCNIVDWCIQMNGGSSYLQENFKFLQSYNHIRKYRIDDQPDEFLLASIGKYEVNHINKIFKTVKDLNFAKDLKK